MCDIDDESTKYVFAFKGTRDVLLNSSFQSHEVFNQFEKSTWGMS